MRRRPPRGAGDSPEAGSRTTVPRPSTSRRSSTGFCLLLILLCAMTPAASALKCQCTMSTSAGHCGLHFCDINPRDGKVPACVFVQDGPRQHYACIRVKEDQEMGCRAQRVAEDGRMQVACTCRDKDYCNVELAERVDQDEGTVARGEGGGVMKVPAEPVSDNLQPVRVPVRVEPTIRSDNDYDIGMKPDRDPSLGVAPKVVDLFGDENEENGGYVHSEEENGIRSPQSASYRPLPGVDERELVPLVVKKMRTREREREMVEVRPKDPRRQPPSSHHSQYPPPAPSAPRQPDWRVPGAQPVPDGRGRDAWQPRPRADASPATTTTASPSASPPPPAPARPPTPFSIGRINSFVEPDRGHPIPYPYRPPPVNHHHNNNNATVTTPTTTTTHVWRPRRPERPLDAYDRTRPPPPRFVTPPTTTTTTTRRSSTIYYSKSPATWAPGANGGWGYEERKRQFAATTTTTSTTKMTTTEERTTTTTSRSTTTQDPTTTTRTTVAPSTTSTLGTTTTTREEPRIISASPKHVYRKDEEEDEERKRAHEDEEGELEDSYELDEEEENYSEEEEQERAGPESRLTGKNNKKPDSGSTATAWTVLALLAAVLLVR